MIRRATLADLPELLRLEELGFPGEHWTTRMLADEMGRSTGIFLVAEEGERLAGAVVGWTVIDELEVLRLSVDPALRRRGTGRALLQALEVAAPAATVGFLEVRDDNVPAIGLYLSEGYRPINVRKRYYADGCDARVLHKRIERR